MPLLALQWWCRQGYDGELRAQPYEPDLSKGNALETLALFWTWVKGNFPGWHHWKNRQGW
jgi:hypothetical protein